MGVCILLGEVAVVIKSYDRMTTEGDRDLCYYNEKCYRSVTWMDMPANSGKWGGGGGRNDYCRCSVFCEVTFV